MTTRKNPAERLTPRAATTTNPRDLRTDAAKTTQTTTSLVMPRAEENRLARWVLDFRETTGISWAKTDILRALIDLALTDPDVRAKAEQRARERRSH